MAKSASSATMMKKSMVVIMCMVMVIAPYTAEAAITCGQISRGVGPCVSYLRGAGPLTPSCCAGVKGLAAAAKTPFDRKTACSCLKTLFQTIRGINLGLAAGLPGKCGAYVPYKISPSTDCSKVT